MRADLGKVRSLTNGRVWVVPRMERDGPGELHVRGSQCRGQETSKDEIERDHRVRMIVWGDSSIVFLSIGVHDGIRCRALRRLSK